MDYNEEGWIVDGLQGGRMDSGWITRRKDGLWVDYKEEDGLWMDYNEEGWIVDGLQ